MTKKYLPLWMRALIAQGWTEKMILAMLVDKLDSTQPLKEEK